MRLGEPKFHLNHRFDEIVTDEDTYRVNKETEAVLYHYMIYRYYHVVDSATRLHLKNDYTAKYFARTLEELRKRQLDLHVLIPQETAEIDFVDIDWPVYELVYKSRKTAKGG
jgi:hypothetical protein